MKRREIIVKGRRRPTGTKHKAADLVDPRLDLQRLPYLTFPQAAVYLGYKTVPALKMAVQRGTIEPWCITKLGRSVRFIREALDQLLQKKERLALANRRAHGEGA